LGGRVCRSGAQWLHARSLHLTEAWHGILYRTSAGLGLVAKIRMDRNFVYGTTGAKLLCLNDSGWSLVVEE
jgi:hypothetical protein